MQSKPTLLQRTLTEYPKEFRANPSVPGARAASFIDDITAILAPELSLDMAAMGKVAEWLQERLGKKASR